MAKRDPHNKKNWP